MARDKIAAEVVRRTCYKPHALYSGPADESRCRHHVHDAIGVGFHQCSRKPVEVIEGCGFCKQHAAQVQLQIASQKKWRERNA